MAFKLYILRHGAALMQAPKDSLRMLSEAGKAQAKIAGERLADEHISAIIASPYVRAQQTAEIVSQTLGFTGNIATCHGITPDDTPSAVLTLLDEYSSETALLMVSHQPLVGSLIGCLVDGDLSEPVSMGTGSVVCLSMDVVGLAQAELKWSYHSSRW